MRRFREFPLAVRERLSTKASYGGTNECGRVGIGVVAMRPSLLFFWEASKPSTKENQFNGLVVDVKCLVKTHQNQSTFNNQILQKQI